MDGPERLASCASWRSIRSSRASRSVPEGSDAPGLAEVSLGSCRHQFMPICSALSIEQISRRTWMVRSSTFARLILMSPAITRPLSSTRSRMSTSPWLRDGVTRSAKQRSLRRDAPPLANPAQRAEIDAEVIIGQSEDALQLFHAVVQAEQRESQTLHLRVGERASFHSTNRLMFQDLTQHLDQRQDKARESLLHLLGIRFDSLWQRASERGELGVQGADFIRRR